MAKKQKAQKVEVAPQVEDTVVVEQPEIKATNKMVEAVIKKPQPKKPEWEVKDRTYYLTEGKRPLSHTLKSSSMFWFDEEKGYEREVQYCENQRTCFVDEMQGERRLSHIMFRNGALFVPREKTVLQKFLSNYHPMRDKLYYEHKPVAQAVTEVDRLELEIEALDMARSLPIEYMEAIMRAEMGSKVSRMSSSELKRDTLLFAKKNPILFLELAADENVMLRNFGIRATEMNILTLSSDQRTFSWTSNGRKLMTVPFDEHPYSALAAWFKTDEGMEIYSNIEKRLK